MEIVKQRHATLLRVTLMCGLIATSHSFEQTYCMANCSKPSTNRFCRITRDVCAYPFGDQQAYEAVRSLALWRGEKDDECIARYRDFMCAMYFPDCRFRVTIPVCYNTCYQAHLKCYAHPFWGGGEKQSATRCQALVGSLQVAGTGCAAGWDSV